MMRSLQRFSPPVAWLLLIALPAGAAASSFGLTQGVYKMGAEPEIGERMPVDGPVFRVYARDANGYDFVGRKNESIDFKLTATASCSGKRRTDSAQVEIAGVVVGRDLSGERGGFDRETFVVSVPHTKPGSFNAVKACNDMLQTLTIETGRSKAELIRQGFTLRHEDSFAAKGKAFCTGHRGHVPGDRTSVDVWVSCEPNPKVAEVQRAERSRARPPMPLVRRLELEVDPAHRVGPCPTGVTFTGSITTNRKGTVKYRTVAHDGSASPVFTLEFPGPAKKAIGRWGQTFAAPDPDRLAAAQDDESAPTYKGWRRLEIVEPKGFAPSARAEYVIICGAAPVAATVRPLAAPARVQETPARPATLKSQ